MIRCDGACGIIVEAIGRDARHQIGGAVGLGGNTKIDKNTCAAKAHGIVAGLIDQDVDAAHRDRGGCQPSGFDQKDIDSSTLPSSRSFIRWRLDMATQTIDQPATQSASGWLKGYYFTRFAFSAAWVATAFTAAKSVTMLTAIMLVGYPAWDAIANYADAQRNGGLRRNKTQLLNFFVSIVTAVAVAITLRDSMNSVLVVFGIWASFAGILQLATGVKRWKSYGAQWAMILSGAQSTLAGVFMIKVAGGAEPVGIANIAPYAAFGAFYFLVSALWLAVSDARKCASRTSN
jgi:uncharacterized membrane protein HdeD (DUF308 family)